MGVLVKYVPELRNETEEYKEELAMIIEEVLKQRIEGVKIFLINKIQ